MHADPDIQEFLRICGAYMDIEALGRDWEHHFIKVMANLKSEEVQERFRRGFAKSVLGGLSARAYEVVTNWDFDTEAEYRAHLMKYWTMFYPDSKPEDWVSETSPLATETGYRGWQHEEEGRRWYTVDRLDGSEAIFVESLEVVGRRLETSYKLNSPSMYDGLARKLIRAKILHDVCLDKYRGEVDEVAYMCLTTGNVKVAPYD